MRRTLLLLLAVPVVGLAAVGHGLTAQGGPQADDPDVAAAHRAGLASLSRTADALVAVAGHPELARYEDDRCLRGSRAVGGLGVDTPYRLECSGTLVVHTSAGPVAGWREDAQALHDRLVAAGWEPNPRALPQLAAETPGGGIDRRPGPADLAAGGYVGPDGTELSIVFAEPGEHPDAPVDDGGARGWETADRLPPGGYGVVLRLASVTVSA